MNRRIIIIAIILAALCAYSQDEAPTGDTINVYITVTDAPGRQIAQDHSYSSLFAETMSEETGKYFVLSIRTELFTGKKATAVGANVELGNIGENGFYFAATVSGGSTGYIGSGVNFGGTANKDGKVKIVFGGTSGFWNAPVHATVYHNGTFSYDYTYNVRCFGGVFWKLMLGENGSFDISNKLLFGSNVAYSLSVGYTLTKKRGK